MSETNTKIWVNVVGGATQATLVTIVGYPFDLVKTRLQTGLYANSWDCLIKTVKTEGVLALYRGSSMPWISHLVKRPIQYPISEFMKEKNIANNYVIGALSGLIGPVFGTPLQVVKVSVQASTGADTKNALTYIKENYNKNGVRGFYRGFTATVIKDGLFGASFIGNYYTFRDLLGTDAWWKNFVSGSAAHCITWFIFIPVDYVKTTVQRSEKKITAVEIIKDTVKNKGVRTFWKGVVPACIRTVPVSGIAMTGYEYVRKRLMEISN